MNKRVRKLKFSDAAYIAGLMDGEGTISLTRAHKNEYRRIDVSISNCDRKMLDWVAKKIGAGKILPKKIYSKKHNPAFTYRIVAREVCSFLKQILPYLHTYKKERAKLILKKFVALTPRNGKYSLKILNKKRNFIKEFFSLNPTKRN